MTMISLNDRLMLECPEDYNEMADQLDADDCEEVEEANAEPSQSTQPNGNGLDRSELVIIEDKSQATYEAEEDLEDLEETGLDRHWSLDPFSLIDSRLNPLSLGAEKLAERSSRDFFLSPVPPPMISL